MNPSIVSSACKRISMSDVLYAWQNVLEAGWISVDDPKFGNPIVAMGCLPSGEMVELKARIDKEGNTTIFHSFCPPQLRAKRELEDSWRII